MRALDAKISVDEDFAPDRGEQTKVQSSYDQHLKESERRLREAERLARLGHWELDIIANKLHWSAETFRIFGMDPMEHEPSYEAFLNLIHSNDRDYVSKEFKKSVENHTQYNVYHRLTLKSGETKFVNERCRTYYDDFGQPVRSLGTILDMTDHEREIEKLLKAKAGLEIYAGGLEEEIEQLGEQLEHERSTLRQAIDTIEQLKVGAA
jgi:PAS domain S-box-containing protein